MAFPGFLGAPQRQSSDLFTRSVLAGLLLDIAQQTQDAGLQAELRAIAKREADYIAAARLCERAGGWSYFPDLPQLPPDLDSLAAAMTLFARIAPEHLSLCERPIELALAQCDEQGGIKTWLIAPEDPPALRKKMQEGVERYWGDTVDVEVCARFYAALALVDAARYTQVLEKGRHFLLEAQQADGSWPCTWYWSPAYAMELCFAALPEQNVRTKALEHLRGLRYADGGWGRFESIAADTAWATYLLAGNGDAAIIEGAAVLICDQQSLEGYWKGTPWIRMDIGRAQGKPLRSASYGCAAISTAACVRALQRVSTV